MSDFSKSPLDLLLESQQKGYVGLHIEQGVPILDRDLNLLHDLITATVRSVIGRYIGNGISTGADGFAIQALPAGQNVQDFRIMAGKGGRGTILVNGIEVTINGDKTYKSQDNVAPLTTPNNPSSESRTDIVYLDVFLVEVDGSNDTDLKNSLDVGMQTSVRLKPDWRVRVAEGIEVPPPPKGHSFYPLAQFQRPRNNDTIEAGMITDLRQLRLTAADMEQRLSLLENVLALPAFANLPQFIPRRGVINQGITLFGKNFNIGALEVFFNDTPAKIVGAASATQVTAQVPPGLTPSGTEVGVKITVKNAFGSDTSDDTFTVRANPAFADPGSQFSPNHGIPGTQITLNGFNFNVSALKVKFDALEVVPIGTPTANQIVVQVPTGLVPAGSTNAQIKITVTTSAGTIVSDDTFTAEITVPAPAFATLGPGSPQFTPRKAAGNVLITLFGQNFNFAPVEVKFDATTAALSGAPSATQIAVLVPPNMTTVGVDKPVKITVTTAGGSDTSDDTFTISGP